MCVCVCLRVCVCVWPTSAAPTPICKEQTSHVHTHTHTHTHTSTQTHIKVVSTFVLMNAACRVRCYARAWTGCFVRACVRTGRSNACACLQIACVTCLCQAPTHHVFAGSCAHTHTDPHTREVKHTSSSMLHNPSVCGLSACGHARLCFCEAYLVC